MEPQYQAASAARTQGGPLDIAAIYQDHREAMYGVARSLLRGDDQHRAEDVVQDVMVSIMSSPPTDVVSWEALLVTAVKRKVYDLWRLASHRHERLLLDDVMPIEGERLGGDDLGLDVEVVVEETEQRTMTVDRVRDALAHVETRFPEAYAVFWQVKGEGRTSKEVAAELGVSGSRVRQHVMKVRRELIKLLEAGGGE